MKKLWNERVFVARHVERTAFNGRINPRVLGIELVATAYYDISLSHVVLDLYVTPAFDDNADEPFAWAIGDQRLTKDRIATHEAATRWVIANIDNATEQVRNLIPPEDARSDEEIIAEASA